MKPASVGYLQRLKEKYSSFGDNDSLLALADIEKSADRARELTIYREQEKTKELIKAILLRYRACVYKLTSPGSNEITSEERAYTLASMDWCTFTLDIVGESPELTDQVVDDIIASYARKAGIL